MSTQRFTPAFRDETVRHVVVRGYPVAEIAVRLGVSTHSLYKWVQAVIGRSFWLAAYPNQGYELLIDTLMKAKANLYL